MANYSNKSNKSISPRKVKHDNPVLIPVRQAYMEIKYGVSPNYDRWMKKWDSNNYASTRLACTLVKTRYGTLPSWRKNSKVPEWLITALNENKQSFGDHWP